MSQIGYVLKTSFLDISDAWTKIKGPWMKPIQIELVGLNVLLKIEISLPDILKWKYFQLKFLNQQKFLVLWNFELFSEYGCFISTQF